MRKPMLRAVAAGLYCEPGGFHIDPQVPVASALITHAHGDHAVPGSRKYLTAAVGRDLLQFRLGPQATVQGLPFGESIDVNGVRVSFHPAGHILGSAQIRLEHGGEVWVVSGDYKLAPDGTCDAFEPVRCDGFVTESTFAHPYYRWDPQPVTMAEIHAWWRNNQQYGKASFLYAYSLGKAQRLLAGLDPSTGPVFAHEEILRLNGFYRAAGRLDAVARDPETELTSGDWGRALLLLPPKARWKQNFPIHGTYATAFASGWMVLPDGPRSRRVDRGFALSDHADSAELVAAVKATGAEQVWVTHGYIAELVRILQSEGIGAVPYYGINSGKPPSVP